MENKVVELPNRQINTVHFLMRLPEHLHLKLKILAAKNRTSMQKMLVDAIKELVKEEESF